MTVQTIQILLMYYEKTCAVDLGNKSSLCQANAGEVQENSEDILIWVAILQNRIYCRYIDVDVIYYNSNNVEIK